MPVKKQKNLSDDIANPQQDRVAQCPNISLSTDRTYATVNQMLAHPKYNWATNSFIRHIIFNAEDRIGSGGALVPGNGLAPAILRIGRKVLIDLDEFDRWLEQHRMEI